MNIAYDHIRPDIIASTTDAQAPGMFAYTDRATCKACGGFHPAKWAWRKVRAHRHAASWYRIETWEEGFDLIYRAKKRWVGKGSLLIQWHGESVPQALSIFFVPKRKAEAVNSFVPKGYPTKV